MMKTQFDPQVAKSDPNVVFRCVLERGQPPDDWASQKVRAKQLIYILKE